MSGECSRRWFVPKPSRNRTYPGSWDQPESVCHEHGEAPYFQDEWYGYRWQVGHEVLDGMAFGCLTDGDLAEIGVALQTAVAAWETEATRRGMNIETTTEENSNG